MLDNRKEKFLNYCTYYEVLLVLIIFISPSFQKIHQQKNIKVDSIKLMQCSSANNQVSFCERDTTRNEILKEFLIEKNEWSKVLKVKSQDAFENHLLKFPNGYYSKVALRKLKNLEEEESWNIATIEHTQNSYSKYLEIYPNGKFAVKAKTIILEWKEEIAGKSPDSEIYKATVIKDLISEFIKNEIVIPAGSFVPGSNTKPDEMVGSEVIVESFILGNQEVTQSQYQKVMGVNPSYFSDCDDCPVENVSWTEAIDFITRLNRSGARQFSFRLPTEYEWEYAAMGGYKTVFAGSNEIDSVAVYEANSIGPDHVKSKQANAYGLYDMSGNVAEWCNDWYIKDAYKNAENKTGTMRVVRGGSFISKSSDCRVKNRSRSDPERGRAFIGFRLARELNK